MLIDILASAQGSGNFTVFNEIALIIAVGTAVAFAMKLLRQPLIIGHIITGIIVGPTVFDLIKSEETITVFANLGIALLLFIIGLGLNPKVIKEVGKAATVAGLVQIMGTTTLGYLLAIVLGFEQVEAAIIAIALAFSSTIIILKLISDLKEQNRLYAKISVGVLLIQDIVATLALLVLSSSSVEGGLSGADIGLLVVKATTALLALYVISEEVLPRMKHLISDSQEFLFLFALGWGLGVATLFEIAGFSLEVGALLAGVGLATQSYTSEIASRLKPLRDFFVVVFFISLGTELAFDDFFGVLGPALLLSLLVITFNPFIIMTTLGLLGYTRKISYKVGVGMAQISEFSLVFAILAERQGKISSETLSILTLIGLITIAVSTYMITYADSLYDRFEGRFKMFERKKVAIEQREAAAYPIILFGYKKGGDEYIKTFRSMKKSFVVVDYDPLVIDRLEQLKLHYIYGDANDIELLEEVGVESARLVISTITEHQTNQFLVKYVHEINPSAVVICHSDSTEETLELYDEGASYVIVSHTIGSEKISNFLKRNGLKQSEFQKFRDKHISNLVSKVVDQPKKSS